jgi:hypothetical protein
VHQIESFVDVLQRHGVSNQIVDVDLFLHVPVDDPRHFGTTSDTAKGGALPDATGDELERPCSNFLTSAGDTDDDALAPAAVAAFQSLPHDLHVADAFE